MSLLRVSEVLFLLKAVKVEVSYVSCNYFSTYYIFSLLTIIILVILLRIQENVSFLKNIFYTYWCNFLAFLYLMGFMQKC